MHIIKAKAIILYKVLFIGDRSGAARQATKLWYNTSLIMFRMENKSLINRRFDFNDVLNLPGTIPTCYEGTYCSDTASQASRTRKSS
jgi:hypothetical protein